jgi:hypothetical protein
VAQRNCYNRNSALWQAGNPEAVEQNENLGLSHSVSRNLLQRAGPGSIYFDIRAGKCLYCSGKSIAMGIDEIKFKRLIITITQCIAFRFQSECDTSKVVGIFPDFTSNNTANWKK